MFAEDLGFLSFKKQFRQLWEHFKLQMYHSSPSKLKEIKHFFNQFLPDIHPDMLYAPIKGIMTRFIYDRESDAGDIELSEIK